MLLRIVEVPKRIIICPRRRVRELRSVMCRFVSPSRLRPAKTAAEMDVVFGLEVFEGQSNMMS